MRVVCRPAGLLALLLAPVVVPGIACGMAVDGAMLTNQATATYQTQSQLGTAPSFAVSYSASSVVLVSCPVIAVQKWPDVSVQLPGGTVTFTLCALNRAIWSTAFNFTITDTIMNNVAYMGTNAGWGTAPYTAPTQSRSADNVTWTNGTPAVGQVAPYYLRWVVNLNPGASVCVQYYATVIP
jgi:hypothetical protein